MNFAAYRKDDGDVLVVEYVNLAEKKVHGSGRHRRPTLAERAWAYRAEGLLVLAAAVASGLITGAFIAVVQAVN